MSYKVTEIQKYREGKLHVYKRSDSRFWLCRFYAEGKYKTKSTGEMTLTDAKSFALDWYDDLKHEQRHGKSPHQKTFDFVAKEYLEYQKTLVANYQRTMTSGSAIKTGRVSGKYRTERQSKDYMYRINALNNYFSNLKNDPERKKYSVGEIQTNDIEDYIEERMKSCSQTTVKYDLTALSLVMQFAKRKYYITHIPDFPKLDVSKTNPRPSFSEDEWKVLLDASRKRIEKSRGTRQRYEREQLHDFMLFSVHTGMRVNEVLSCKYKDCKIEKKKKKTKDGKSDYLLEIKNVLGKNDVRTVTGLIGAVRAFERLKNRNNGNPDDKLFPHHHRDQLNNLLRETGLKFDALGNVRNAKSFRSTYIMFRLVFGIPIKDVAVNCGNSSTVIDKYYAKYITSKDMKERLSDYPQ